MPAVLSSIKLKIQKMRRKYMPMWAHGPSHPSHGSLENSPSFVISRFHIDTKPSVSTSARVSVCLRVLPGPLSQDHSVALFTQVAT